MAPVGGGWLYQSRIWVVERTITSGLIELTHCGKSKATGRTAAAAPLYSPTGAVGGTQEGKVEARKDDHE